MKYRVAAAAVLAAAALLSSCLLSGCKGKEKPDPIVSSDISSNGKIAVTAHDTSKSIQIWNLETGKRIRTIKRLRGTPVWASISSDGKTAASISSSARRKIKFNRSWTRFVEFPTHLDPYDDAIQIWDVATGKLIQTLKEDDAGYAKAVFSPDGKMVVSIDFFGFGGSKLWNAQTGKIIRHLSKRIPAYAFSPDGRLLASSERHAIQLWNGQTGEKIAKIDTKLPMGVVLFSPDGKTLAHVGINQPIHLWDVKTRAALHTLENPANYIFYEVVFSPDGTRCAAVAVKDHKNLLALVWDVETGKIVKTLPRSDRILSVAFTEDGSEIVGMSAELLIQRWDLKE